MHDTGGAARDEMTAQPAVPSRWQKFRSKTPAGMARSISWNARNLWHVTRARLRFNVLTWGPSKSSPSYLAYYPDGLPLLPDLSGLYARWIRGNKTNNNGDASRFLSLVLNLRQLDADRIPGDFAELGVWKGNSAAILADFASKSGRRLFLFDTFSGFDGRDLVAVDAEHKKAFSDTSVPYVQQTVDHPETTIYLQGFFPETVTDEVRDSTFAFVHIDCDLYGPMKAALEFFYARLSVGGMLVMHDYSSGTWPGATKAVDEFLAATGEFVTLWPDKSGTAMLRKSRTAA